MLNLCLATKWIDLHGNGTEIQNYNKGTKTRVCSFVLVPSLCLSDLSSFMSEF